jgi:Serpentine type 7TM GPCR chemoreceptor Srw
LVNVFRVKVSPENCIAGTLRGVPQDVIIADTSSSESGGNGPSAGARRITLMCLVIASCFTLTSMPLGAFNFAVAAGLRGQIASDLTELLITLRTLNACIDPIIYGLMWRSFRKSLLQVKLLLLMSLNCLLNFVNSHNRLATGASRQFQVVA